MLSVDAACHFLAVGLAAAVRGNLMMNGYKGDKTTSKTYKHYATVPRVVVDDGPMLTQLFDSFVQTSGQLIRLDALDPATVTFTVEAAQQVQEPGHVNFTVTMKPPPAAPAVVDADDMQEGSGRARL